jgi:predicted ArsR family transcriptional regulator
MVEEKNRIVTKDIAGAVGVDETDVREHVDEMIAKREIPVGTKITYVGGEKVVK